MWSNQVQSTQPTLDQGGAAQHLPSAQQQHLTPAPTPPIALPAPASSGALALSEGAFDVPATLMERIELCQFLAKANLLPAALREQPANILLIMHKAMALSIPLGIALEHMYVIDGKVGHSAELLRAMLRRHGHLLRWISISDKEAIGELVLRHDPNNPRREKFTIADAQRMKLVNKDNWQKDPESMLVARCSNRLVSRHCPEIAVALGNLSAVDTDDDAVVPDQRATTEFLAEPTLADQAAAIMDELNAATTPVEVKELGHRARQADLLNHVVEGDKTIQQAVLARLAEVNAGSEAKPRNRKAAEK